MSATRIRSWKLCLRCPGIGPWTAQYIAMRALGSPMRFRRAISSCSVQPDAGMRANSKSEPRLGGPGAPTRQCIFGKE